MGRNVLDRGLTTFVLPRSPRRSSIGPRTTSHQARRPSAPNNSEATNLGCDWGFGNITHTHDARMGTRNERTRSYYSSITPTTPLPDTLVPSPAPPAVLSSWLPLPSPAAIQHLADVYPFPLSHLDSRVQRPSPTTQHHATDRFAPRLPQNQLSCPSPAAQSPVGVLSVSIPVGHGGPLTTGSVLGSCM